MSTQNVICIKGISNQPQSCCLVMKIFDAVLGKFCACWLVVAVVVACTLASPSQVFIAAAPACCVESTSINRLAWPPMKHHDIWSTINEKESAKDASNKDDNDYDDYNGLNKFTRNADDFEYIASSFGGDTWRKNINGRQSKVLHLFPVPVDGECLSDDGRRTGTCFNAYECRLKGGMSKGECAMGFGVCCVFIASCNQTIMNNITYLVSPNFPSFMPNNFTTCRMKVKMLNTDISQLRIDFNHFSLGQPNRRTGGCDGDVFNVTGGPAGTISLCGQNSGQHMYYDVGSRALPRQTLYGSLRPLTYEQLYPNRNTTSNDTEEIEITMDFSQRFLPIRLWEIRIVQIPFSQRAPAGCLQYFTGTEGILQTFNYAENGRHLANQHYRICMRQETEMCSVMYEPCDEQSFRIGPNTPLRTTVELESTSQSSSATATTIMSAEIPSTTTTPTTTTTTTTSTTTTTTTPAPETTIAADALNTTEEEPTTSATSALNDNVEGSGDDSDLLSTPSSLFVSRRPRPVSGGFDILGFLRSTFDLRFLGHQRQKRQFSSTCTDRITMPCIIEDFIGAGFGSLPGCEPVHCGSQFCNSGMSPCRIESTVTPFYIGVHFGDGRGKGSAEDNIGVCLRYTQVQCM